MFERVCKEDALFEGDMRIVVAGQQLVVLAWAESGVVKAFQGVCPHTNTPSRMRSLTASSSFARSIDGLGTC